MFNYSQILLHFILVSAAGMDEKDHYNTGITASYYKAPLYRMAVQIASKRFHCAAISKAEKNLNGEASMYYLDLTHILLNSVKKIPVFLAGAESRLLKTD